MPDPHPTAPLGTAAAVFRHPLRVYWEDTDAGGVVFYANYLKFFERARTEWLRSLGVSQLQLQREQGVIFVVAEATLRLARPARLDDALAATVAVEEVARASLRLRQQVWRDGDLLAEGLVRIGCVRDGGDGSAGLKPSRIPAAIFEKLQAQ